jgi:K+-sensing histidine kinase KdpD
MIVNFYTITALINFITCGTVAIFVVLKGDKTKEKIGFIALSGTIAIWNIFYFLWQNSMDNHDTALFFARALAIPVTLIPAAYTHFAYATTEEIKKRKKALIITYAISLVFCAIAFTPYFVDRVEPVMNFNYWPMANTINSIYWVFFSVSILYSSYILIRAYFIAKGVKRLQLRYITIGCLISFFSGSFNILPWYKIAIPPVGHALVPFYIIMIAYAITRYRLMNIKIAVRNVFFYFIVSILLYAIFYLIAFLHELFFGGVFVDGSYILGIILGPVGALIMYGGSEYLSKFVNKYFFRSIYEYQKTIIRVSHQLSHYTDLEKIIHIIINTIDEVLRPLDTTVFLVHNGKNPPKLSAVASSGGKQSSAVLDYDLFSRFFKKKGNIIIKEELDQMIQQEMKNGMTNLVGIQNQINQYGIYICLPLKNGGNFTGVIAIGEKKDSDSYTQEDIKLLEILAYQAGIAIDNAILYKKIEEKNKYLRELLESKNDFIRIANHQLNTPLSIMRQAYSMVNDKSITIKEGLFYWNGGMKKMEEVMEGIWKVLELEGEINTRPELTNLISLTDTIISDKKKTLKLNKKIKIVVNKNQDLEDAEVICDPKQINFVFINLLENAISYTPKGIINIDYELINQNKYLKISVKDTGIGFSEEDAEKIGQKFYRSKEAMLVKPDGSGLGVYVCKKFVENNKGVFSFSSEGKKKGATFSFSLPVKN